MSLINIKNSKGPKTDPCGTPYFPAFLVWNSIHWHKCIVVCLINMIQTTLVHYLLFHSVLALLGEYHGLQYQKPF